MGWWCPLPDLGTGLVLVLWGSQLTWGVSLHRWKDHIYPLHTLIPHKFFWARAVKLLRVWSCTRIHGLQGQNLAWGLVWTSKASNASFSFAVLLSSCLIPHCWSTDPGLWDPSFCVFALFSVPWKSLCRCQNCCYGPSLGTWLAVKGWMGWILWLLRRCIKQVKIKGVSASVCLHVRRKDISGLCILVWEVLQCHGLNWCSAVPSHCPQTLMPPEDLAQLSNLLCVSTTSA